MTHSRFSDLWMETLFRSKAAASGGLVRRKASDVEKIVGKEAFVQEVERRGFRAIENSGQIIVVCNTDPVRILC